MRLLGIDLGGTNVRAGLVDESRLLSVDSSPVPARGSEQEVLAALYALVDRVAEPGIRGIGVGVPSVVDVKQGIIYDVQNIPSWKKVPLRALLEERYRVPVYVNNDANCFAVGEKYYGKGRPYEHLVGLIVGTGLGAGIIANGRLYCGANCGAGEFGMIPYRDRTLEYYACGQFFENVHGMTGREAADRARRGEVQALRMFDEFGIHLAEAVKVVLYAADPEIIIFGGSVSRSYGLFRTSLWASLQDFPYAPVLRNLRLEVSEVDNIALLGAAALFHDAARG